MIVEGGIWIFGFAVLAIFISVFRFCVKNLRFFSFSVHCGLRIFHFLAFGFRFSRNFGIDILCGFQFFLIDLPYLGFSYSSI